MRAEAAIGGAGGDGRRVAWSVPTPSASRPAPHGRGGVILHILHPAPPQLQSNFWVGKSRPRALPIGQRSLPLWRDWAVDSARSPDVTSAIRFVGRGDPWPWGLGCQREGGGSAGRAGTSGRAGPGLPPLLLIRRPNSASVLEQLCSRSTPAAVLGSGEGGRGEVGSRGDGLMHGDLGPSQRPQP